MDCVENIKETNGDNNVRSKAVWAFIYPNYEPTRGEVDEEGYFRPYQYGSRRLSDRKVKTDGMQFCEDFAEAIEKYDMIVSQHEAEQHKKLAEEFSAKYIDPKHALEIYTTHKFE